MKKISSSILQNFAIKIRLLIIFPALHKKTLADLGEEFLNLSSPFPCCNHCRV